MVEIYLVQHGKAKPEEEDPERSLTELGKEEVSLVARYASGAGARVAKVFHSPKLRAKQTAEILARALSASEVREADGLLPLDNPEIVKAEVEKADLPLMLVGHLPHLSRLASLLVVSDPEKEIIKFRPGGIVGLSKNEKWIISWILTPEIVKK